ncbi:hypothetical protein G6F35_015373 [Rhizopus arrhizus]|nr:hypothetical protein G6F35_015373 [Rhizopus arrhizus]
MPSRISSSLSTHSTRSPASESLRTGAATACAGVANSVYPGSGATRGRMIENIEPLPTRLRPGRGPARPSRTAAGSGGIRRRSAACGARECRGRYPTPAAPLRHHGGVLPARCGPGGYSAARWPGSSAARGATGGGRCVPTPGARTGPGAGHGPRPPGCTARPAPASARSRRTRRSPGAGHRHPAAIHPADHRAVPRRHAARRPRVRPDASARH